MVEYIDKGAIFTISFTAEIGSLCMISAGIRSDVIADDSI